MASDTPSAHTKKRSWSQAEIIAMNVPPRQWLMAPVVPEQGLVEVYARRGVGKTLIGIGMAHAIARGADFLKWKGSGKECEVLYVDGEMPLATLAERILPVVPKIDNLRFITPDLLDRTVPELSEEEGQSYIWSQVGQAKLIVLDNLSSLVRIGRENDDAGWLPVQDFALRLRRKGVSVMVMHHAGKNGTQRGTSRKEDVMDTVMKLVHPPGYRQEMGALFEIHFEKDRNGGGEKLKAFQVKYEVRSGAVVWSMKDEVADEKTSAAWEMKMAGKGVPEIAKELGISPATVYRMLGRDGGKDAKAAQRKDDA